MSEESPEETTEKETLESFGGDYNDSGGESYRKSSTSGVLERKSHSGPEESGVETVSNPPPDRDGDDPVEVSEPVERADDIGGYGEFSFFNVCAAGENEGDEGDPREM